METLEFGNVLEKKENEKEDLQREDMVSESVLTEETFLDMSMQEWVAQMQMLQMQGYSAQWQALEQQLASICTQTNIRYIYFDVITERIKMKQIYTLKENLEKMDYQTMSQILTDFAQANLNYMDYMYTDSTFEDDQGLLMPEEKAALWIANGLSMDNSRWREKLQCFSEAAKIYPIMGDFVKRYMQLYGNELVR